MDILRVVRITNKKSGKSVSIGIYAAEVNVNRRGSDWIVDDPNFELNSAGKIISKGKSEDRVAKPRVEPPVNPTEPEIKNENHDTTKEEGVMLRRPEEVIDLTQNVIKLFDDIKAENNVEILQAAYEAEIAGKQRSTVLAALSKKLKPTVNES